jgi:hypothetical protein
VSAGPSGPSSFSARISAADRAGLLALVREHLPSFTERDVLHVLRHPYAAQGVIEEILAARALLSLRAVRRAIALHPATPRHAALQCLDDLTWRDLLDIGREARTPPPVRKAANHRLLERLRRLTEGEKIALARFASRELFPDLLNDESQRVVEALLANPRLTADDVMAWLATGNPGAPSLAVLAAAPRWIERPAILAALLVNRVTPRPIALSLLSKAGRPAWHRLAEDPAVDPLLAACARTLLRTAP